VLPPLLGITLSHQYPTLKNCPYALTDYFPTIQGLAVKEINPSGCVLGSLGKRKYQAEQYGFQHGFVSPSFVPDGAARLCLGIKPVKPGNRQFKIINKERSTSTTGT